LKETGGKVIEKVKDGLHSGEKREKGKLIKKVKDAIKKKDH